MLEANVSIFLASSISFGFPSCSAIFISPISDTHDPSYEDYMKTINSLIDLVNFIKESRNLSCAQLCDIGWVCRTNVLEFMGKNPKTLKFDCW